jgi:hypothetical protein
MWLCEIAMSSYVLKSVSFWDLSLYDYVKMLFVLCVKREIGIHSNKSIEEIL